MEALGHARTLAYEPWPVHDPALTREDTVEIVVQLDGKCAAGSRCRPTPRRRLSRPLRFADARVQQILAGRTPRKVIVVPGKLVNLVV